MSHWNRGKGAAIAFLRAHIGHEGDDCVPWPLYRKRDGYGVFGHCGEVFRAHRWMCEAAYGAPPSQAHEAAHSCGNSGCVNPRHLSWKTSAQNHQDKILHGTTRTGRRPLRKLTVEQVQEILSSKGQRSEADLAKAFNVSERHIRTIRQGVSWRGGQPQRTGVPRKHGAA